MKPSDKELEELSNEYFKSMPKAPHNLEHVCHTVNEARRLGFKDCYHLAIAHMQEQHEKELYKVNLDKQSYNEYYLMLVAKIDSLTTQNEIMEKALKDSANGYLVPPKETRLTEEIAMEIVHKIRLTDYRSVIRALGGGVCEECGVASITPFDYGFCSDNCRNKHGE